MALSLGFITVSIIYATPKWTIAFILKKFESRMGPTIKDGGIIIIIIIIIVVVVVVTLESDVHKTKPRIAKNNCNTYPKIESLQIFFFFGLLFADSSTVIVIRFS